MFFRKGGEYGLGFCHVGYKKFHIITPPVIVAPSDDTIVMECDAQDEFGNDATVSWYEKRRGKARYNIEVKDAANMFTQQICVRGGDDDTDNPFLWSYLKYGGDKYLHQFDISFVGNNRRTVNQYRFDIHPQLDGLLSLYDVPRDHVNWTDRDRVVVWHHLNRFSKTGTSPSSFSEIVKNFGLNKNYRKWTNEEEMIFRMAVD